MYPPERIPLPEYPEDDLDDCVNKYSKKNHEAFTPEKMREAIAAYYACVSFMDAQAGRVLTALEDSGRAENTIVVVWGDHGFHLGEHMLWQKYTAFEESCRVPLLIRAPGVTPQSVWCSRPVECLDLFPTLTDLCGLGVPENIEGVSMKELLATPEMPWKKAALTEMPNVISLRSEQFRYVRSRSDPSREELYDHERDPREIHNVARDMEYDYVLAEMRGYAEGGWKSRLPG
ncbi:MAG: Choline-sulfatase [candidate division BRC1 bacterium ADurb.BinA364]|nr:MAG: Choline-sulfatase [candidate division BRC1 bacterium ADurb.BinA364]